MTLYNKNPAEMLEGLLFCWCWLFCCRWLQSTATEKKNFLFRYGYPNIWIGSAV